MVDRARWLSSYVKVGAAQAITELTVLIVPAWLGLDAVLVNIDEANLIAVMGCVGDVSMLKIAFLHVSFFLVFLSLLPSLGGKSLA